MTRMLMRRVLFLATILLLSTTGPAFTELTTNHIGNSPRNQTGVDVGVTSIAVKYTNSGDEGNFKMFSSNHPILGFNRPASLYVIDGMVNVSSTLTVGVENFGTAGSGVIDVTVSLNHNEYDFFELNNTTVQMASLAGGQSNSITVSISPSYAGNHTLVVTATSTVSDDVPGNDMKSKAFTVGYTYFNCDTLSAWNTGNEWGISTDTSISKGTSCHVGKGSTSSYSNNMMTTLITPQMDMSDAVSNPLRTNGFSFFYTGSAAANDVLKIYAKTNLGGWTEVATISNTVDGTFLDGVNWQTFSVTHKGAASPLIPMDPSYFHSSTQVKFEFTSDASGTDIGYWVDDIVFVYDQKVRENEYQVSARGIATNGATPGNWGSINLEIVNDGNISETFIPTLQGLPVGWNAYYSRLSGTSFNPSLGLTVTPGAPVEFRIMLQPDENASIGLQQMSVAIASQQYGSVGTTLPVQFLVMADRIPIVTAPAVRPSCPPSYSCTFEVELDNIGDATDVFDLSYDLSALPSGWDVGFTWSQPTSILIRPNEPTSALMTMTVPAGVAPDTVVSFDFTMSAQNDTTRTVTETIDISASMVTDASVDLVESMKMERMYVDAGEEIKLTYTIWNNATRQDIFDIIILVEDQGQWIIEQPTGPPAVINSGGSASFDVYVSVPTNAQANDRGPRIIPVLESQRSFMTVQGPEFDSFRVKTTENVGIEAVETPLKLTPSQPNAATFMITNHGNGDTEVQIDIVDLPTTWDWWMMINGENHSGPISLSVSYDLEHTAEVDIWLLLPMEEAAGEQHSVRISVQPTSGNEDSDPLNNFIEFTSVTDAVHSPVLKMISGTTSTIAGGIFSAQASLENQGNARDDNLRLKTTVYSTPALLESKSFLNVGGVSHAVGDEIPLILQPGEVIALNLDVMVPGNSSFNTRFVVLFEILGSVDENGFPVVLSVEHLIILDQQRSVETSIVQESTNRIMEGTAANVWVNHTSTSTLNETMVLTASGPKGWQISCNKILIPETGLEFPTLPGHVTPQTTQSTCEVLRLSGSLEGEVFFTLNSIDGHHTFTKSISLEYDASEGEQTFSNTQLIAGGSGGLVFVVALLFLLRRRGEELVLTDEIHEVKEVVAIKGPPINGPPSSNVQPAAQIDGSAELKQNSSVVTMAQNSPQPIPDSGLPHGWSEEQWSYYGQQYLDGTL
tara:strand:+ start:17395 stop:20964 length:3570 start_codon:yes stop_codon:yes gene_type:complete